MKYEEMESGHHNGASVLRSRFSVYDELLSNIIHMLIPVTAHEALTQPPLSVRAFKRQGCSGKKSQLTKMHCTTCATKLNTNIPRYI